GGIFPKHIEPLTHIRTARWLEKVLHLLPVEPRPEVYSPLDQKNLDPSWIARLGQSGKNCFEAIRHRDVSALGASFNECMRCWETVLPHTVRHRTLSVDLKGLLRVYQAACPGAMYSGCGGGYLIVVSEKPLPGSFQIKI